MAAESAELRLNTKLLILFLGFWEKPLPEPPTATEFTAFTWTSVTSEHAWSPASVFSHAKANILSQETSVAMGGSIPESNRLRGRGLHVPQSDVLHCVWCHGSSTSQISAWASRGMEAPGFSRFCCCEKGSLRASGSVFPSSFLEQKGETSCLRAPVQTCPALKTCQSWIQSTKSKQVTSFFFSSTQRS